VAASVATGAAAPAPAVTLTPPDRCYTGALIEVFLDHTASVYEIQQWADRVGPGPMRPALPRALAVSDEWLAAVVVGIYDAALDRPPGAGDLEYWVDRLRAGERVVTLTALVYGSPEVYARAGSTAQGFVADVFPRIMGRTPSAADVSYWASEVPRRGRGGVAKALVGSVENRRARVTTLYREILGRTPETAGRDYWVGRLATIDDVQLAVQLASSAEAYDRAGAECGAVPTEPVTTQYTDGDANSTSAAISGDGEWVAFTSTADDLVPDDDVDSTRDLFLLHRPTGTITKVTDTDRNIRQMAISQDGRHVVFETMATDVLPGADDDGHFDVYSWARETDTFTRITDGDGPSTEPGLSADGRYVVFSSTATDLEAEDDDVADVFVWDRETDTTERVSEGTGPAERATISPDGDLIAFTTGATTPGPTVVVWNRAGGALTGISEGELAPLDIGDDGDVILNRGRTNFGGLYHREADTGVVTTISEGDAAIPSADLAADGATVAFTSYANGTFPGDTVDSPDVFVWERATGAIAHIGVADTSGSTPTTSADGRYVAFHRRDYHINGWAQIAVWDRGS